MASIRRLETGTWQVRWREGGRERSKRFFKKTNADRFKREVEYRLDQGTWLNPRAGQVTLNDWFEQAWSLSRPVKARTATDRAARMAKHVLPTFGRMPLAHVGREQVQEWVNGLTESGLAPATVKKGFETLSAPMRTAVEYERLQRSPCDRINLPPIPKGAHMYLIPEEVDRLALAISPHYELLVRFAAETGLRFGEYAGLWGQDYNRADRTICVKRQLLKDSSPAEYGDPKTKAGFRSLALSPQLAERIECQAVVGDFPMFTTESGALLNISNFRSRQFRPTVAAANLTGLRIHDLRHTAISLWIDKGATIKVVTERGGIESAKVAFDTYGHLYPTADRDLADRLHE